MSSELNQLLELMMLSCVQRSEVPDYRDPLTDEAEKLADEYCLVVARTGKAPCLTNETAKALIPRLQFARTFGSEIQSALELQNRCEDEGVSDEMILTEVLVRLWREVGKKAWSEGVLSKGG